MTTLKKYWFLIVLAFVATILFVLRVFVVPNSAELLGQATPTPQPQALEWNGIRAGQTTVQDLQTKLGEKFQVNPENGNQVWITPPAGGPPHEVNLENGVVGLVKDRIFSGNISSFREKFGNPEAELYGDHAEMGFKTYIWANRGIAVVAHQNEGLVFEVWYFKPTTLKEFYQKYGQGLTVELEESEGY